MTKLFKDIRSLKELVNGSYMKRGDESPSLHFIVLLLGWWVAASMAWVGTPLWIWFGGGLLLTVGHVFSWMYKSLKSPIRTGIVSLALLGSLTLVPAAVMKAVNGDWLAISYFLILFQGIAAFEMRSRGGLYASIIVSGAIFFFVSQLALDITFIIFLTGFTTLLLSFLALSFLLDQIKNADVRWFQNRFGFSLFWTGVFVASMLTSAAIFLLLPKQLIDPINEAHGAVLPMRASDRISIPEVSFEQQSLGSALPVTAATPEEDPDAGPEPNQTRPDGQASSQGNSDALDAAGLGPVAEGQRGVGTGQGTDVGSNSSPTEAKDPSAGNPLIMQVRSPVLTYWRDKTYDRFVDGVWHQDDTAWFRRRSGGSRAVYAAPQPRSLHSGPLYNQTFFMKQALGEGEFFSGYSPMVASIPRAEDGSRKLEAGSTYRVISALPDFSLRNLRNADSANRQEYRYHQMPPDTSGIQSVATQVTAGAFTDVDRMRRIITYIDRNYEYDVAAVDQMALTSDPTTFIESQGSGTGMDIATATVLLARGAGIPARLVTGYLPGQFDPLSGTYMVRASDRHTWAEVFFSNTGWVPFDSAPRPSTAGFGEGGTFFDSPPVGAIFSADLSEDIYDSVRSAPQRIGDLLNGEAAQTAAMVLGPVLAVVSLLLAGLAVWRFAPLLRHGRPRMAYSGLPGDGRQDMLRVYFRAEKLLRKKGFPPRQPSQTIGDYSGSIMSGGPAEGEHLAWLQTSARKAAYDPNPFDSSDVVEAKNRLARLRENLRESRRQKGGH